MRDPLNPIKLQTLMEAFGKRIKTPGRIYLTGGATALLHGWRQMTIDVDLKADPEPSGFFEAIAILKDELSVNIELANPSDFIPELPNWKSRSIFISKHGPIEFYNYDPYSQALSKLERSHNRDLADVKAMLDHGLILLAPLIEFFEEIEPRLIRYHAIDPKSFRHSVMEFCHNHRDSKH